MDKNNKRLLSELEAGFIPYEFNYTLEKPCNFQWSSLKYDDWTDVQFWFNKLPDGLLEQFPCLESYYLDWAIECSTQKSPLQEIEERTSFKSTIFDLEKLKI